VANALQHASAGSTIRLKTDVGDNGTYVIVENQGEGIAPDDLDRVFDRFYRTDAARHDSAASCGLGLAIVRTIMILHQGRWSANSGQGVTRFLLFFPAAAAIIPAPPAASARPGG
jgi:two-component system heavy metal sensor histidine kinase CusS